MQQRIWQWAKWASLTVSAGSILLAVILMWFAGPAEVERTAEETTERPKTEVESPVIVERKDGEIIWQLRATEAKQQANGRMKLLSPVLTMFTESGQRVIIKGKNAVFHPINRNIRFQDQVKVNYEQWQMNTRILIYKSALDEIHVPETFDIFGENIKARGKNMRLNRNSETINVDGGIWIQDSDPKWQGVK